MDVLTSSNFYFPKELNGDFNINASSLFLYCVIICVCIIYFRSINITLGSIIGLIIAALIIYVVHKREIETLENKDKLHKIKSDNIRPLPEKITKYEDLTDLIFSIQDFYMYNPQSFELMIKSIDILLDIYENCIVDNSLSGQLYENAKNHKLLALNYLQSVIIMIPSDKILIEKLNTSMRELESLLNKYLSEIYERNINYINEKGYFNNSKIMDLNMSPYNQYSEHDEFKYY